MSVQAIVRRLKYARRKLREAAREVEGVRLTDEMRELLALRVDEVDELLRDFHDQLNRA